jgi:hypothetical protein
MAAPNALILLLPRARNRAYYCRIISLPLIAVIAPRYSKRRVRSTHQTNGAHSAPYLAMSGEPSNLYVENDVRLALLNICLTTVSIGTR